MNNAHLYIDVHCSDGVKTKKKKKDLAPLLEHDFGV